MLCDSPASPVVEKEILSPCDQPQNQSSQSGKSDSRLSQNLLGKRAATNDLSSDRQIRNQELEPLHAKNASSEEFLQSDPNLAETLSAIPGAASGIQPQNGSFASFPAFPAGIVTVAECCAFFHHKMEKLSNPNRIQQLENAASVRDQQQSKKAKTSQQQQQQQKQKQQQQQQLSLVPLVLRSHLPAVLSRRACCRRLHGLQTR